SARSAAGEAQRELVRADRRSLGVAGSTEALALDRTIGGPAHAEGRDRQAIAALDASAEARAVEAGLELVEAGNRDRAGGRHPVVGKARRRRDIGRAAGVPAIDAGHE